MFAQNNKITENEPPGVRAGRKNKCCFGFVCRDGLLGSTNLS